MPAVNRKGKKQPTCGQVLEAINESIVKRWLPAIENEGRMPIAAPRCGLCVLFFDKGDYEGDDEGHECLGCPLHLMGKNCFTQGAPWVTWSKALFTQDKVRAAVDVALALLVAREKFFGIDKTVSPTLPPKYWSLMLK